MTLAGSIEHRGHGTAVWVEPGGHDAAFWDAHMGDLVRWASERLADC